MQGPFGGIAGTLRRVFGGVVTITPAGSVARDIQAVFRHSPVQIEAGNGVSISTTAPILRANIADVLDLLEGDLVDPKDGTIYRFLYRDQPDNPAADASVNCHCEVIQ
jgi:hypothetical protein